MTLRSRLTAAFLCIVLLPVLVGALLVARAVPTLQQRQNARQLAAAGNAALLGVRQQCRVADAAATVVGQTLGAGVSPTRSAGAAVSRGLADAVVIEDAHGMVRTVAGAPPTGVTVGSAATGIGDCQQGRGGPAAIGSVVALRNADGTSAGQVWAGFRVDRSVVTSWRTAETNLTVVFDGRAVESTLPAAAAARVAAAHGDRVAAGHGDRARALFRVPRGDGQPLQLVVGEPVYAAGPLYALLAVVVLAALVVCLFIAYRLARAVTRPLRDVGDAAQRVAAGDLHTRIPVRGRDEVAQLAGSFNTMTVELQSYVDALRSGRDQLRHNLALLGDTLSSTHDMNAILGVVLDTSMNAAAAQAGAIYLAGVDDLYCKIARGVPGVDEDGSYAATTGRPRVRFGEGVVGTIARSGEPQRGRVGEGGLEPASVEPEEGTWIAVPFTSSGRLLGVLALYDRIGSDEFDDADLLAIRTFAGQAAVAVDNVRLHQEAHRLSVTDELTGLWNYRYFQMSLTREIERAARFGRTLALLMLDLDHFKAVNDHHGHQRGDAVLAEVARRVGSTIREVDVLARYGGEEMVLVLPETDLAGAEELARRICEVVHQIPVGEGADTLSITVSVGVAIFPQHATSAAQLLDRADEALYAAKSAGSDCWRTAASIPA